MKPVLHETKGDEVDRQKSTKQNYLTILLNGTQELTAYTEEQLFNCEILYAEKHQKTLIIPFSLLNVWILDLSRT